MWFRLVLLCLVFARNPRAELLHIARKHLKAAARGEPR